MDEKNNVKRLHEAIESSLALADLYMRQSISISGEKSLPLSEVLTQMAMREMLHAQLLAETARCAKGGTPPCVTHGACPARIGENVMEMLRIDRRAVLRIIRLYKEMTNRFDQEPGCLLQELLDKLMTDERMNFRVLREISRGYRANG